MSMMNQKPAESFRDTSIERPDPVGMAAQPTHFVPPGYVDQEVSRFFYRWGGQLASTLIRIRSHFDGDLDQYLLYLTFLLAELSQVVSRADAEARGDRVSSWTHRGMNALSVADITQVPRETARRKLQLLVARGYLLRGDDGLYYLGDQYGLDAFFSDLRPLFWDGLMPTRREQ